MNFKMTPEQMQKIVDNAPEWAVAVNLHNGMYYDKSEVGKGDLWLMDIRWELHKLEKLNKTL